jgi:hypothetical protein
MYKLVAATNHFDPIGHWTSPIDKIIFIPIASDLALFDQNGYDLTDLEKRFASCNNYEYFCHREHRHAIKKEWIREEQVQIEGAHLNHSLLFERKGYAGEALAQLKHWAVDLPTVNKLIAMRPKWGLDFSMDYVDCAGNAFEVLHWEYDGFDHAEIEAVRQEIEPILLCIDWQDAAKQILQHKDQWHCLDFFAQSDWKCNYFGVPRERFKMVAWQ